MINVYRVYRAETSDWISGWSETIIFSSRYMRERYKTDNSVIILYVDSAKEFTIRSIMFSGKAIQTFSRGADNY